MSPGATPWDRGVADAAAERVHEIFFRMAIGREFDPLAAAALADVVADHALKVNGLKRS